MDIPLECINCDIPLHLLSQRDTIILKHLQHLLIILNRIEEIEQSNADHYVVRQVFSLASELCCSLRSYSQQTETSSIAKFDLALEHRRLSRRIREFPMLGSSKLKCFDEKASVEGERLIFERRMLAVIALIAFRCPALGKLFLDEPIRMEATSEDASSSSENENVIALLVESLLTIGVSVNEPSTLIPKRNDPLCSTDNSAFAPRTAGGVVPLPECCCF